MTSIESFGSRHRFEPARSRRHTRLHAALRQAAVSTGKILGLVALLGVGLAIASSLVSERSPLVAAPLPTGAWLALRRPIPVYALTGTDFARLPLDYAATRNALGGGRRDTLTFGDPHGDTPWLRITLYRVGKEAAPTNAMADDLARLGREAGLAVSTVGASTPVPTRFGPVEASDLKIGSGSDAASCVGFRRAPPDAPPLRIEGLVCGGAGHPVGRDLIGCVIDRIDLLAAGDDRALRDVFVAAERRRGLSCRPALESPSGRGKSWLDVNSAPPPLKPLTSKPPRS